VTGNALAVDGFEPPQNHFLADSPWPMSHRNPYNQASSPLRGPEPGDDMDKDFIRTLPVSITLAYSNKRDNAGNRNVWGATLGTVYELDMNGRKIDMVASKIKGFADDPLSGAYIVMDKDDNVFVPHNTEVRRYKEHKSKPIKRFFRWFLPRQNPEKIIKMERKFTIPSEYLIFGDDYIVGMNMTYDGFLVLATSKGVVCAVDRHLSSHACLILPSNRTEGYDEVSNSIAVDETGGVFIVTNKKMHRVQWTGNNLSMNTQDGAWSANYEVGPDEPLPGRLGTGSGSTPSLMGSAGMDQFVVFTDGQELTHLVLMWRGDIPHDWTAIAPGKDRRIAAEIPVTFGNAAATRSISEQSVLVRGYSAMVVNNDYKFDSSQWPGLLSKATVFISNLAFNAPYGVERFSWNPNVREFNSDWANPNISCPNGIPTMSAASNIAYCIGQRNRVWNLEGMDWDTGESVLDFSLGILPANNSFYAATQIGDNRDIVTGTFGGVVRVQASR
jgi:hypothetical protein